MSSTPMQPTTSFMILFIAMMQFQFTQSTYCKSSPLLSTPSTECNSIKDVIECLGQNPRCVWDTQGTFTHLVGPHKLYTNFRLADHLIAFPTEEEEQHISVNHAPKPPTPHGLNTPFFERVQHWTNEEYLHGVEISQVDFSGVQYFFKPNPDYHGHERRKLISHLVADVIPRPATGVDHTAQYPFTATGVLTYKTCEDNRAGNEQRAIGECTGSVIQSYREPAPAAYVGPAGRGHTDWDYILTAGHCCRDTHEIHNSCGDQAGGGVAFTRASAHVQRYFDYYSFNFDFYQGVNSRRNTEEIRPSDPDALEPRVRDRRRDRRTNLRTARATGVPTSLGAIYIPQYLGHAEFVDDWCVIKLKSSRPDVGGRPAPLNLQHLRIEYNDNWNRIKFLQPTYDFHLPVRTTTRGAGQYMQRVLSGEVRDASGAGGHGGNAYWYVPHVADPEFKTGMSGSPIVRNAGAETYNNGAQWQVQIGIAVGTKSVVVTRARTGGREEDVYVRFNLAKFNFIVGHYAVHLAAAFVAPVGGTATAIAPAAKRMYLNVYNNQRFYNEYKANKKVKKKYNSYSDDVNENDYYGDNYEQGFTAKMGYTNGYNNGYNKGYKMDPDKAIEAMELRWVLKLKSLKQKHKLNKKKHSTY